MIEVFLVLLFLVQVFGESIVIPEEIAAGANYVSLVMLVLMIIKSKAHSGIYYSLFFLCVLSMVFLLSLTDQHKGGGNSFLILSSTVLFLGFRARTLDYNFICNKLLYIAILYVLFISFYQVLVLRDASLAATEVFKGPFSNQNTTAMITYSLMVFLGIFSILANQRRALIDLIIFMLFLIVLLTQSRAGALSASIFLLGYSWIKYRHWLILPIGLFGVILALYLLNNDLLLERILVRLSDLSGSGRTQIWSEAYLKLTENYKSFLFGIGVNNMTFGYGKAEGLSAHNAYINFIANYGVIAFFFLVLFLFYILFKVKSVSTVLFFSILSSLVYGVFETNLFTGFGPVWLVFLYSVYFYNSLRERNAYINNTFRTLRY